MFTINDRYSLPAGASSIGTAMGGGTTASGAAREKRKLYGRTGYIQVAGSPIYNTYGHSMDHFIIEENGKMVGFYR
jgi:hypothetical protein